MAINYWQTFYEGSIYHIYNHAAENLNLFTDEKDFDKFLEKYSFYFGNYFNLLGYCLMPNHFHLLCRVKEYDSFKDNLKNEKSNAADNFLKDKFLYDDFFKDQMRRFFSSYSLTHKKRHKRNGPLFRERFKRVEIRNDSKLSYLLCYIHHNPIHHGFKKRYNEWEYSSYLAYLSKDNSFVNTEYLNELIGGKEGFEILHKDFKIAKEEKFLIDHDSSYG